MKRLLALAVALAGACAPKPPADPPADPPAPKPPELAVAVRLDQVSNGVTTTRGGRVFVVLQRGLPGDGPEVAELVAGKPRPFPDDGWNGWRPGQAADHAFVAVNAIRVGPDGDLWVVDTGVAHEGATAEPNGPKLVAIDLARNRVRRVYPLANVALGASFVDDVRFDGRRAYLADGGDPPAIIVLDLDSGAARRVLEADPSTRARRPLTGEGRPLADAHGRPVVINVDRLEVSPDGRWLYYQPCTGPMSRIETRYLDDTTLKPPQVAAHVEPFADTHSTGGTAMDASGTIYATDTDALAIRTIDSSGRISTLVRDPRLVWADALWIDERGTLWIPAAQLDRTKAHHHGADVVQYPVQIFTLAIGAPPLRR